MTEVPAEKSTIVRFFFPGARLIRPVFRALDRFAPRIAVGLAARLWCTPPRPRAAGRGGARRLGGHRSYVLLGDRAVAVETWSPPDGTAERIVYLVHGWGGWRGQLDAFVPPLVAAGFRVVSFDALAHGESSPGAFGRLSTLPEMADTLAGVVRTVGPAYGVVAHSLGASASALAVLDGLRVGRLVLVAPLADPPSYTHEFAGALGFGEGVRTAMIARVERMVGRPFTDFDVPARLPAAAGAGLPPMLLVHDRDDKEVRHGDGPGIASLWPEGERLTTGGLGHRRILRDPYVVAEVVDYLAARVPAAT
ncbi:MAG TPA: alpha/beta fold hydrolase [Micromonosporaceae bacterium]|nr:alpha/beta fold hydrolase [Micromonosporaceae bacterium]